MINYLVKLGGENILKIPVKKPKPDFDYLVRVVNGERKTGRVLFAEMYIDDEVKEFIIENYFNKKIIQCPRAQIVRSSGSDNSSKYSDEYKEVYRNYLRQNINFYYRMGYSIVPDQEFEINFSSLNTAPKLGKDTAVLSRGERNWAQEGIGMIKSWEDFEKFPWVEAKKMLLEYEEHLEFLSKNLPDGMKIAVGAAVFEPLILWMLGYEGFSYAVYDKPDLVGAVFDQVGQLVYNSYVIATSMDGVGVVWHGDDFGFKTATIISPDYLRRWVFPWLKKYREIAHKCNKSFWLHTCGYKYGIMKDLIKYVKIDALHSFEDACCPIIDFKKKYGEKVGLIGGVDVDKLASLGEEDLRKYIRNILDACMPGGRYIFGSGNSICNYVPVKNFLIMIDEGYKWE